jgi:hypothetical protein
MNRESNDWCEAQFKKYMGAYTNKTLMEVYDIYVRPGAGGAKWTKEERKLMNKIRELNPYEISNPYAFRFLD